jgi:hypothetical protein
MRRRSKRGVGVPVSAFEGMRRPRQAGAGLGRRLKVPAMEHESMRARTVV